jgi:hypothetical protein
VRGFLEPDERLGGCGGRIAGTRCASAPARREPWGNSGSMSRRRAIRVLTDMDQRKAWGSRSLILAGLLAVHLGLLAWALLATRTSSVPAPRKSPSTIVYLPPIQFPRVYAEHTRLEPMRTNVAEGLAPPLFASSTQSGSEAAADGRGSAVNWAAEAHRAVRAFEIRRDHPRTSAISVSMSWEDWVLREHHPGERYKTEGRRLDRVDQRQLLSGRKLGCECAAVEPGSAADDLPHA